MKIEGLDRYAIRALVAKGKATKVAKAFYVWGQPEPREMLALIQQNKPTVMATGATAAALYVQQELTFPLHLAAPNRLAASPWYQCVRTSFAQSRCVQGFRVHEPLVAASLMDIDAAVEFIEHWYAKLPGRWELEKDMAKLPRLPKGTRERLRQAALFTDSSAEQVVIKELRKRGLQAESNVRIGPYSWDIVLPKLKVAVEIDGSQYHWQTGSLVRDHWKNNDAALRGWLTLRYTGYCVAYHLGALVEQISTARHPDFSRQVHTRVANQWHSYIMREEAY